MTDTVPAGRKRAMLPAMSRGGRPHSRALQQAGLIARAAGVSSAAHSSNIVLRGARPNRRIGYACHRFSGALCNPEGAAGRLEVRCRFSGEHWLHLTDRSLCRLLHTDAGCRGSCPLDGRPSGYSVTSRKPPLGVRLHSWRMVRRSRCRLAGDFITDSGFICPVNAADGLAHLRVHLLGHSQSSKRQKRAQADEQSLESANCLELSHSAPSIILMRAARSISRVFSTIMYS
jgi:hypothetical protein